MSHRAPVLFDFPVSASSDAPADAPAGWRLRLLGAVELLNAQARPVRLPTRAATLLLARLAMAPQRQHPREELMDLLWPGVDNETGRNRLRQALSVLRSLLEAAAAATAPVLYADRRAVWLAPGAVACDVVAFEQALAQGHAARGLRLYQGDLLPGHFDEWVLEHRAHIASRAEALAALQPGPSVSMSASASPSTAQAAVAAAAAEPDVRLPRYLTRLIGFDAAAAALADALAQHRLVVLRGPGGAGKTRLAVEVARALAQRTAGRTSGRTAGRADAPEPARADTAFDLVAFVALASCTQRAQMLDTVLHALRQDGGADPADAAQRVARSLAGRRVLLVLDNFEQLVEAGRDDVARWLSDLPDLHLLVTSRRMLGLDGEVEQVLAALPLPALEASLADHALNPSLALFVDRARAARADFQLSDHNHALAADLVRALHGLPLAIELAAARLRSLGLADLHAMLAPGQADPGGAALSLLVRSGPRAPDDARHASMLHVLQWSWQQLSPDEQWLLAGLAACDGGASLNLLTQLSGLSLQGAALLADSLVAASVAYERSDAQGASRYWAFEPMREFVFVQAAPAGVAALRARHAGAVAAWATGLGVQAGLRAVRQEWPNLLRALASGADPAVPAASAEQTIDTCLILRQTLEDQVLHPSALDHLRAALQASAGHRESWVHALLAVHSFEAGQRQAAAHHAASALALADPSTTPAVDRAHVLRCAARVKMRLGDDPVQTLALADEAIALATQHGQMFELGSALTTRSILLLRRDHDARDDLVRSQESLALWRAHGPGERVTSGLIGVALSLGLAHRTPEQLLVLQEARALATDLNQQRLLALVTSITGYALADLRRYAEAADSFRHCLQMSWDNAIWRVWFYALWNLPRTLAHLRQPEAAAQLMGFAEAFYAQRFGQLGVEDLPEARRTRRLVLVQLGSSRTGALWRQGAGMGMGDAMRLAMQRA